MKNYYEILGIPETATAEEIAKTGRKIVQQNSVDHIFAGRTMGVDYTEDQWRRANVRYAEIIEAYQILKDQTKRKEYDSRLSAFRRQKAQEAAAEQARRDAEARARQNVNAGQGYYGQTGQRTQSSYAQQGYRQGHYTGQHEQQRTAGQHQQRTTGKYEQRSRTQQTTGGAHTQRNPRSGRYAKQDSTMERSQKRTRKPKGAFGKMVDSFKEVRQDEREYPYFERHQDLNRKMRKEFHQGVKSVPGEIVYQMANGTIHITYEFIHQLKKLGYLNEDSVPKYVFRNRKLAAAALAVALMATMPGGGEDIQAFPTPDTTIEQTQETTTDQTIEETMGIVYEEPEVIMNEYYEVVAGDTLSDISTRTGVKVHDIMEANGIINKELIRIGDKLVLPYVIDRDDLQFYTITVPAKGISCRELAKKYNTDEATIRMLNEEAIAFVGTEYVVLTDTAVVPNFISVEEFDMMRQAASTDHMKP